VNINPEDDPMWQRLSQKRSDDARARLWTRYRADTLRLAQHCGKQGRLEDALATWLELCYIDLNGPQNPGNFPEAPLPDFDPARAYGLGPVIITRIAVIARRLGYDEARTKVEFLATASAMHRNMNLPVTPEDAWNAIRAELYRR
jgi:hypothetical protein